MIHLVFEQENQTCFQNLNTCMFQKTHVYVLFACNACFTTIFAFPAKFKKYKSFNLIICLHYLPLINCRKKQPLNPLPDMPILGSSNSAANKDMTSKIWTNGDKMI